MSIQRVTCHRDWFINRALQLEGSFFSSPFFFLLQKNEIKRKKEKQQKQLDNSITKAGLGDKGDIARNVWFTQTKSGNYQTRL